ncbi:hypothetical protein JCM10003_2693 [Bacteroides pyogenes JCM 10003]|nr:hypothetical protein JCM10003_2693 [Bacteroides pyogenes JCM 10003]
MFNTVLFFIHIKDLPEEVHASNEDRRRKRNTRTKEGEEAKKDSKKKKTLRFIKNSFSIFR